MEKNGNIPNLQTLNSFSLHYIYRFVQITPAYYFRCNFVSTSLRSSPSHSTTFANGCSTELWDTSGYRIGIGRQLFINNVSKGAQLLFSCDFKSRNTCEYIRPYQVMYDTGVILIHQVCSGKLVWHRRN